jgi:hypothetical protein
MEKISIRAVTGSPGYHWFGYYDKEQFDGTGRYLLGMEAHFQHHRPRPDDSITIGMIDLLDGDRWLPLGQSRAWCWQSGCMLQWRPGHEGEIMWNDRGDDGFVSHILNVRTGQRKTLPFAFFTVHNSGKTALGLDFERLEYMRPGYGYSGVCDRNIDVMAPDDMGIYNLNFETGAKNLIISLRQVFEISHPAGDLSDCKHYFNCLLFNPEGSRFVVLHRWRTERGLGWPFKTRMMIADPDGSHIGILVPGGCGHFNWRDDQHLIVQEGGFSLYEDGKGKIGKVGEGVLPDSGGHISYLPGNEWLVGDTYPDESRHQRLYLYNVNTGKFLVLGSFYSPVEYTGSHSGRGDDEWRCDLHPRISRDGGLITMDSPHGGNGRQIYLVDIGPIIHSQ